MIVNAVVSPLCELVLPIKPDIIDSIGALGFIFALQLVMELDFGAITVRKTGKLSGEMLEQSYALEFNEA